MDTPTLFKNAYPESNLDMYVSSPVPANAKHDRATLLRNCSVMDRRAVLMIAVFSALQTTTSSSESILTVPPNSVCTCSGDVLTYRCTTMGGASTVWGGTAINCPSAQNQIVLRYSEFEQQNPVECNDGMVVGQPLYVNNNCYTSQLQLNISGLNFNNKTVECRAISTAIKTSTITVISGSYPQPNDISLVDVISGELILAWNSVNDNCSSVSYLITAIDCGDCPSTVNTTSATCTTVDLPLTNSVTTCSFTVQSKVCGYISSHSNPMLIKLKVPDAPAITVVPRYFSENQSLISIYIHIQQMDLFNFANNISGSPSSYNITSYSTDMITDVHTSIVALCDDNEICAYSFTPIRCSEYSKVVLVVSAMNQLGEGPPTEPTTVGCWNKFVEVKFDPSTSTITCLFLNQSNTAEKSCTIEYRICQQGPTTQTAMSDPVATNSDTVTIMLELGNHSLNQALCYTVSATSGELTAKVEGRFDLSNSMDDSIVLAVVLPVVAIILLISVLVVILTIVISCVRKRTSTTELPVEEVDMEHSLYIKSVVRGYHVYKKRWTPEIDEPLSTKREPKNKHDSGAVAVVKSRKVVGHIPGTIAKYCSTFIKQNGSIICKVKGDPQNQKITMTTDKLRLEVPCIYKLSCNDTQNFQNIQQVFEGLKSPLAELVDQDHWTR